MGGSGSWRTRGEPRGGRIGGDRGGEQPAAACFVVVRLREQLRVVELRGAASGARDGGCARRARASVTCASASRNGGRARRVRRAPGPAFTVPSGKAMRVTMPPTCEPTDAPIGSTVPGGEQGTRACRARSAGATVTDERGRAAAPSAATGGHEREGRRGRRRGPGSGETGRRRRRTRPVDPDAQRAEHDEQRERHVEHSGGERGRGRAGPAPAPTHVSARSCRRSPGPVNRAGHRARNDMMPRPRGPIAHAARRTRNDRPNADRRTESVMSRPPLTRFALLSMARRAAHHRAQRLPRTSSPARSAPFPDAPRSRSSTSPARSALAMLEVAARPEDEDHPWGHGKAEMLSSGVEGTLILVAAVSIAWAALDRLRHPQPLESVGVGLAVSAAAAVLNLVVGLVLLRAAKKHDSITLRGERAPPHDGRGRPSASSSASASSPPRTGRGSTPSSRSRSPRTSCGTGVRIVRDSVFGSWTPRSTAPSRRRCSPRSSYRERRGLARAALRQPGSRRFVTLHVLVPGDWTVHDGHQLLERMEADIRIAVPQRARPHASRVPDDPARTTTSGWSSVRIHRHRQPFENHVAAKHPRFRTIPELTR